MRILVLLLSTPEPHESSNLYTDLIEEFCSHGHEVTIVSAVKENQSTALTKERGAEVLRVKTQKVFRVHPILKGIATVRIPAQFKRAIKKHFPDRVFDLVITPTPPITFVDNVAWLKKKYPALKSYLILRDIFPQNARDLGMIRNPLLFWHFRKKEKKLYKYSDYIGCMSPGNVDYVLKHNPEVNPAKVGLLPNWRKLEPLSGRDESLKAKYGLSDKYVVIFGGNIGEPQKIENIVDIARAYEHDQQIVFLVIGRGTKKKHLENLKEKYGLTNLIIKETIPRTDYQKLVCSADVGLISLSEKFTIPNIPSKTLSYFNAKIPILAAIDTHTDYGKLLEESGAGFWSVTGDIETFRKNFDKLYQDISLRKKMGENGYHYLENKLTANIAYETIMNQIG